ncbi:MAG: CpaF family protein, partial [Anaerovoracaceae bacterium]
MLELSEEVMGFYEERLKSFTELKAKDPSFYNGLNDDEYEEEVIRHVFSAESSLSAGDMKIVVDLIRDKTRSALGVISMYIKDDSVNEIMVNGPDNIFIEDRSGIHRVESRFSSVEELEEIIRNIASSVHREINEMEPILDARLPDGSRVNAVYKNVAAGGPILTIRKFAKSKIRLSDMTESGTITKEAADFLVKLVKARYNIFISGGTSSGKTTFLNALSDFIPRRSRVIIIEDSRELMMDSVENLIQMECHNANSLGKGRVTMDMLIRTSLTMRPDRIIVGEVRGSEVAEMLQAMNTGHDGSMSTGHGNSV